MTGAAGISEAERRVSTISRFEAKISPEPNCGCWLWCGTASGNSRGELYGQFWIGKKHEQAHRVSYQLFKGPIEDGLLVRHTCDMPLCVNPDHLLVGTHQDNTDDCERRGRAIRLSGERHGRAIFTEQIVRDARGRRANGELYADIARSYGVDRGSLRWAVLRGWKHIT